MVRIRGGPREPGEGRAAGAAVARSAETCARRERCKAYWFSATKALKRRWRSAAVPKKM